MIWTANIPIAGQISSSLQSFFLIPLLSNLSFASFRLSFSRYSFPTILFPLSFSLLFTLSFPHYSFRSFPHFALLFCLSPASVASSKCSLMKVWARGDGLRAKHRASRKPFQVGVGHIRLPGEVKLASSRKAICL